MNRGDACYLSLSINIDGSPITEGYADDIELTINKASGSNCIQKYLSKGEVTWDSENSKYKVYLSQEDTYKLVTGQNPWQLRILKDNIVISSRFGNIMLGDVYSTSVLS